MTTAKQSFKARMTLDDPLVEAVPGTRRTARADLVHGARIISDGAHVASVYWSDNAEGNRVEIAIDRASLCQTSGEADRLPKWLAERRRVFGDRPFNVHQRGSPVDWWRAGFVSADDYRAFAQHLRAECHGIFNPRHRWLVAPPADSAMPSPAPEPAAPRSDTEPPSRARAWNTEAMRMAGTAFNTASGAKGQTVERVVKDKKVRFTDTDDLRAHIVDLITKQEGRCALSGLRLAPDSPDSDAEMLASLDRIDSNGHYEPGNLQVVCRFINRWKSDDEDAMFRRLLHALRQHRDDGAG